MFPGGDFSTVSSKVWKEVRSLQSLNDKIGIHAYVAAGICSPTKKSDIQTNHMIFDTLETPNIYTNKKKKLLRFIQILFVTIYMGK